MDFLQVNEKGFLVPASSAAPANKKGGRELLRTLATGTGRKGEGGEFVTFYRRPYRFTYDRNCARVMCGDNRITKNMYRFIVEYAVVHISNKALLRAYYSTYSKK